MDEASESMGTPLKIETWVDNYHKRQKQQVTHVLHKNNVRTVLVIISSGVWPSANFLMAAGPIPGTAGRRAKTRAEESEHNQDRKSVV